MDEVKKIKLSDKNYPPLLKETPHAPKEIYYKGSLSTDHVDLKKAVAIVGTRKATRYGLEVAKMLGQELSQAGVIVVSGLALGIDTKAHQGALEGPTPTWAVLGSGIENILPSTNIKLAEAIIEHGGAIISEYPGNHPADRWTFPQRNRIIAGLSHATIVVEAPERSGALITAYLAIDYNREVGAVPGEITSINSKGSNKLLKLGAAAISSSEDILELIGLSPPTIDKLEELEQSILQCLQTPKSADDLSQELKISTQQLSQKLTMLEIYGKIKNIGGIFHKI